MNDGSTLIDDCFLHDRDRLSHAETLALLQQRLGPIVSIERVDLATASGRVLAEDIRAPHPVPLHTNAAVDGYAFAHLDLCGDLMPVRQTIPAGTLDPSPLASGTAARIFTGAPMPKGADTVAMQEDCRLVGEAVLLPARLKSGANCRKAGEDRQTGDGVVDEGTILNPTHIAALASIGAAEISVFRRLKVALISSGDEVRQVGRHDASLHPGEVWDANTPMLRALLHALPFEIVSAVHLDDSRQAVEAGLRTASEEADFILSTGGASLGAEDHMLSALDALGKRHAWQIAVKPGRPMMFGHIRRQNGGSCVFVGLPGNPVAAFVCFVLYARQAALRLAGAKWQLPTRFPLPAGFGIATKKPDRREFLRGWTQMRNGQPCALRFPRDGSGLISSLSSASGLIEIPEETTTLNEGETVDFLPFDQFF